MSLQGNILILLLAASVSTVHPLTGSNVCTVVRLVQSHVVYSPEYLESECEEIGFTRLACQAARNSRINFSDLYVTQTVDVCCDGWIQDGDSCSACQVGRYGRNCSLSCQCVSEGACDHVTGECSCTDGWTGTRCEKRCPVDRYGPGCSLQCRSLCENGGICHPSLGHCLCDHEWEGSTCQIGCYGRPCNMESDSCSNGAPYSPTGHCMCTPGWDGRYCTEPCPDNTSGQFCREVCQCHNGGLCNWEDGSCLCPPSFSGMYCENDCDAGFYGQDCALQCDYCPTVAGASVLGACDAVEGACFQCPAGFTGPRCTDPCSESNWGISCGNTCDCVDSSSCDRFTGECDGEITAESSTSQSSEILTNHQKINVFSTSTSKPFAIPEDNNAPLGPTTSRPSSFLIPLIVCFILAVVVVAALVVLAIKKPCRRKSTVRSEQPMFKLNHQYADCSAGKDEDVYAEINDLNGGYEVPMMEALDKPTTSHRPQPEVNYYQTPPVLTPSSGATVDSQGAACGYDVKMDNNGYLLLQAGRQEPPEYQTIITRNKWNLK